MTKHEVAMPPSRMMTGAEDHPIARVDQPELPNAAPGRLLSPAARRALEEAAARKAEIDLRAENLAQVREIDGRGGLEPVRYNDWEVKGLASDF